MKRFLTASGLLAAVQIFGPAGAQAGPWEDGMAAYNRGDYQPAMSLFRPLAQQGNARAQGQDRAARSIAFDVAGGTGAGPRDDGRVRGLELPEL